MIVFVFVFFNSCYLNLDYEWNTLLYFFFSFFKTYKNRFDFSVIKDHLFYHHKTDLNFYFQKPHFLNTTKQIWYFDKSKSIIFTNQNRFEIFLKQKKRLHS